MDELILEFVKNGSLEGLKIGLSINEVINILNLSEKDIFPITRRRKGYEKDNLKLSFFKGKLDIISIQVMDQTINFPLPIAEEIIRIEYRKLIEVKELFKKEQINYEIYEPETRQNMICLKTNSRVLIYFKNLLLSEIVMM